MIRKILQKSLHLIAHNWAYKLVSILLAVIVWAIIQGEQIQEVSRDILVMIHVEADRGIRGEMVRTKSATIRGPQAWLLELPKKLNADVYIPSGKLGRYRIRVGRDHIKGFNDRLDISIHEPYLDLFVDMMMERSVPIKEVIHGIPADGYTVEKVSIEPKQLIVKGIRSDLLKMRYIYTEAIDVSRLQDSRVFKVKLMPTGLGEDALSLDEVAVSLQVGDTKINKRFVNIPIEMIGAERVARVNPHSVSILVQGVPIVLNSLKRSDFKAYVELRGLGLGHYEQEVRVKIPEDTVLIETNPEKALVVVGSD